MGLATSTPPVDQDPGAGVYDGRGLFGLGLTSLMLVIFSSLLWSWKGIGEGDANGRVSGFSSKPSANAAPVGSHGLDFKKFRRSIGNLL